MLANAALDIPHSPVAAMGTVTLWVAFLVAAYAMAAGLVGNTQRRSRLVISSVYALYGFFALMMLASALIIYAFVTHDYSIIYVAKYSDSTMPLSYKITAYWGGLDGSMMFWVAVLAAFAALSVRANATRHRDMIGYVVAIIMAVQLFFLAILIYTKNPFATYLTTPPTDGEGLNPLLQNYWMVIHPPSLYIGFVAATIPYAFAMAALASGRLDDQWLRSVRSWMLICWFFLSLGLILGGRWAYEELGWGGYWAWDPVENAGFLPWFTATAFLHSLIIQEQRGMMKGWNMVLAVTTFFLTIFGTFMTRSGVVQSVHAFGEDNELALLFILFMAVIFIVSFGLVIYRAPKLRSVNTLESFVSREASFLLNNWILLACAVFVLFATMFPTISEAVADARVSVGPAFFNLWMIPLGLILLFLAGAAPLLAWRRTTRERLYSQFLFPTAVMVGVMGALAIAMPVTHTQSPIFYSGLQLPVSLFNFGLCAFTIASIGQEFWKGARVRKRQTGSDVATSLIGLVLSKRRKHGGYIVHMGVAIMFIGFAGKAYEQMRDVTVKTTGESFQVDNYTFVYEELEIEADEHKRAVTAHVRLLESKYFDADAPAGQRYEADDALAKLTPAKWYYAKSDQPTTEVSIKSRILTEDVYLILNGFDEQSRMANFRVYINPLINWVWLGFAMLMLGTAICLIPQSWVDGLSPRRRTRMGRIGEVGVLLLVAVGVSFGFVQAAQAQAKPPVEHVDTSATGGGMGHQVDEGAAHKHRPDSEVAAKLMKELVCLCGGCQRENIYECRCSFAANERQKVLMMLERYDVDDPAQAKQAYDDVVAAFVKEAGGEHVLSTPRSNLSWLIPYAAIGGGLLLLFAVGRRWVRRGRELAQETPMTRSSEEDLDYAEILDDELRETD